MSDEPTCPSCGVAYVDHDGLIRTCAKLQAATVVSADARHVARMITAAILFSNGDYDNDGLRHDVDRIEMAVGPIPADTKGAEP